MHDPFFFVPGPLEVHGRLVIEGPDVRHLATVRRAAVGDAVRLCDGAGTVVAGRIAAVSGRRVEIEALSVEHIGQPEPGVRIFQALAKGPKVDLVVQKLVELGVDEIVVFTSGRSVPRWDEAKQAQVGRRWASIAREAAKQSRRAWLPRIGAPVSAARAASMLGEGERALLADEASATPLRSLLAGPAPASFAVIVGPEGGLPAAERAGFMEAGAVPFSLGRQILRTETAALAAAALVLHHAGRLG